MTTGPRRERTDRRARKRTRRLLNEDETRRELFAGYYAVLNTHPEAGDFRAELKDVSQRIRLAERLRSDQGSRRSRCERW